MNRPTFERLNDIAAAMDAIHGHLARGPLADGLVFDAVRARLVEIGEAVKALPESVTARAPDVPWQDIARMPDFLAHRYFDTAFPVIEATVVHDLPPLSEAVERLRVDASDAGGGA